MRENSQPDGCSISVVRSGGFAGLKREWCIESADAPEVDWVALIDACPWNDVAPAADRGAVDRFVWRLGATGGCRSCTATLADGQLTGPWRALVDAVREHKRAASSSP